MEWSVPCAPHPGRHPLTRLILPVIVAAVVVSPIQAQRHASSTTDSLPPRTVALDGIVDVPLLRASERDSRPHVDVYLDGHGPFRFAIETGARSIGVSHALTATLGAAVGHNDDGPLYHVDSINVGTASFRDFTVSEIPAGVQGVDGVLGLPFYQDVLLTLDYGAGRLRLSRDSLPVADNHEILALRRVSDFWGVPIGLLGQPYLAVLDTQNSGAFAMPPSLADSLSFDGGLQVIGMARGVFGASPVRAGRLAGNLTFGWFTIAHPFVNVIELPPDFPRHPNIGTRLLDQFVVTLDQQHARLRLHRAGMEPPTLPEPARRPAPVSHDTSHVPAP